MNTSLSGGSLEAAVHNFKLVNVTKEHWLDRYNNISYNSNSVERHAKATCSAATNTELEILYGDGSIPTEAAYYEAQFAVVEMYIRLEKQQIIDQVLHDTNDEAGLSNVLELL